MASLDFERGSSYHIRHLELLSPAVQGNLSVISSPSLAHRRRPSLPSQSRLSPIVVFPLCHLIVVYHPSSSSSILDRQIVPLICFFFQHVPCILLVNSSWPSVCNKDEHDNQMMMKFEDTNVGIEMREYKCADETQQRNEMK